MSRSILFFIVAAAIGCAQIGCAVDGLQVIDHPQAVNKNATFAAVLVNPMMVLSDGRRLSAPVQRESLFVGIGVPEGFSVTSASYYVMENVRISDYMNAQDEIDTARIRDSLLVYQTRKQAMSSSATVGAAFTGATFSAESFLDGETMTVDLDSVDEWIGFSSRIDLNFPLGMLMDTVFATDDTMFDDSMNSMGFDTVGVTFSPILLFIELKSFNHDSVAQLLYYSKTGDKLPDFSSLTEMDVDRGAMVMAPLAVGNSSALRPHVAKRTTGLHLDIQVRPGSGVQFQATLAQGESGDIRIYDMRGNECHRIGVRKGEISQPFTWDARDRKGAPVAAGRYVAQFSAGSRSVSRPFNIVR